MHAFRTGNNKDKALQNATTNLVKSSYRLRKKKVQVSLSFIAMDSLKKILYAGFFPTFLTLTFLPNSFFKEEQ